MAYIRKTIDTWQLLIDYGYGYDIELTEYSKKEAMQQLKCYRKNIKYPVKIVKKRIKKEV
ncbi:MAG: hypothetical protein MJ232_08675 [archaeon]|nr:hypothetical protein [archaeon]